MKLVLCGMIVALCTYIGRLLSKRTMQRFIFFQAYQSAVVHLTDSVVGMNLALYQALVSHRQSVISDMLRWCAERLHTSPKTSFSSVWRQGFQQQKQEVTFLSQEDVRIVLEGGSAIEMLCTNPSEKQAAIYLKRLEAYVAHLDAEKQQKCKLFGTSGVLTGLLIALLVI